MVKTCSKCKEEKDITCFRKRPDRRDQWSSWCVDCKREYDRVKIVNKLNNLPGFKQEHRQRQIRDSANRRQIIIEHLKNNPCISCNESDISVLDFDHRDRSEKEYHVSNMHNAIKSVASILKEIAKCDVLCGNCHRHKTMHEVNSWRTQYCNVENCRWA